jgi:hypothetical protein
MKFRLLAGSKAPDSKAEGNFGFRSALRARLSVWSWPDNDLRRVGA